MCENIFKVNNKDTRTTPLAYFTPCAIISIVNFEQVNDGWGNIIGFSPANIYEPFKAAEKVPHIDYRRKTFV